MVFNCGEQIHGKIVGLSNRNWSAIARRFFPVSVWLFHYKLEDLRYDIIAGFTVGLTLVPQCMAYAQMANVNPLYGLYSSVIAQFIYALMGTAKDAAIGPSAIVSMMVGDFNAANPLIKTGDNTYSCIMAFMSGLILMLIGALKLGFIVNLFSIPVVSGFTCAAGCTIFASQLKPFFGLKDAPNESPAVFVKQIVNVFERNEEIKSVDVIFGSSAIIFLFFAQYMPDGVERLLKFRNRKKSTDDSGKVTPSQATFMEYLRLVAAGRNVVVFICTTLAAYLLISNDPTFENRISIVRRIEPGIPPPRFPQLNLIVTIVDNVTNETTIQIVRSSSDVFLDLVIAYVIVPLMIMLEMFAITKALGRKNGYHIDATNELIAIGLGNFIQSFFQAFPVTAAVTRCALNDQCKVKTQLASIISAFIVLIAVSALTQTFYYIPKAALAGIIMTAAYNLIDFGIVKPMWREYKQDAIIFFICFFLCLFFDMAYGILICILVNMITFLRPVVRMALVVSYERHLSEDGGGENEKGKRATVVKLSHGMKYPSADKFLDRMSRIIARSEKHIILDCQFFTGIDYTGLQALRGIILLAFRQNKHLIFTNMSDHLLKKVEKIGLDHWLYVDSVEEAVKHYNKEGDKSHHELQVEVVHHEDNPRHRLPSLAPSRSNIVQMQPSPDVNVTMEAGSVHVAESVGHSGVVSDDMAMAEKQEDVAAWVKKQEQILRHLSVQAYFYQDIPISIGNVGNGEGMMMIESVGSSSSDSEREGETSQSSDDDEMNSTRHHRWRHTTARRRKTLHHFRPEDAIERVRPTAKKGPAFARSYSATLAAPMFYQPELRFPAAVDVKQEDNWIHRIRFSNTKIKPPTTQKKAANNNKPKGETFGSILSVRSGILKDSGRGHRGPSSPLQKKTAASVITGSQQSFYSCKTAFENPAYEISPDDNELDKDTKM